MDSTFKISVDSAYKTSNVNFVGTLILLRIPQRANKGSCSGFRKCERIPLTICRFRLQFAESAYNWLKPLTTCGFHLQLRIPRQLRFTKHIFYYLFHGFHKLVPDSTLFVADAATLPVSGAFLSKTVFYMFVRGIKTAKKIKEK